MAKSGTWPSLPARGKPIITRRAYGAVLLTLWLCNIADYSLTGRALRLGCAEMNPVVRVILDRGWFPAVKLIAVPAGLVFLYLARRSLTRPAAALLGLTAAAYGGLMVYYTWAILAGYL